MRFLELLSVKSGFVSVPFICVVVFQRFLLWLFTCCINLVNLATEDFQVVASYDLRAFVKSWSWKCFCREKYHIFLNTQCEHQFIEFWTSLTSIFRQNATPDWGHYFLYCLWWKAFIKFCSSCPAYYPFLFFPWCFQWCRIKTLKRMIL